MAYVVQLESFQEFMIKERSQLSGGVLVGASTLTLVSTQGFAAGDVLYLGAPRKDGCERAVVATVDSETGISLTEPIQLLHSAFDAVTAVLGGTIQVERASDLLNKPPTSDAAWSVITLRDIDPDQISTYYRDPNGGETFWYRYAYTDGGDYLSEYSTPVPGSSFGNYCSLREIREEAGYLNAVNLPDTTVALARMNAQNEINGALKNVYGDKVPFAPVPELVKTLTIQLAAGLLLSITTGGVSQKGKDLTNTVRARLKTLQSGDETITDDDGGSISNGSVGFYPSDDQDRMFYVGQRF
ncbi:hypothetical protein [Rhodococcus erythropolis]|uniref:hypothetical protein n=1 Tax=Rhodococcus erythropolis TaxID=1833 RepID=UPI0030139852